MSTILYWCWDGIAIHTLCAIAGASQDRAARCNSNASLRCPDDAGNAGRSPETIDPASAPGIAARNSRERRERHLADRFDLRVDHQDERGASERAVLVVPRHFSTSSRRASRYRRSASPRREPRSELGEDFFVGDQLRPTFVYFL